MTGELCALAAAIEAGNDPLPPFIGKLIQNSPESFDDQRAGKIAESVRAMRQADEPVSTVRLGEQHLDLATFIGTELEQASLPIDQAEYYAKECWEAFQVRRAKSIGADLIQSLESSPNLAPSIIAAARVALDNVTSDTKSNGFTIRTPDEILAMQFDDSDRMLGDHLLDEGDYQIILDVLWNHVQENFRE